MSDDFRSWFGAQLADQGLSVRALSDLLAVYDRRVEDWLTGRALPTRAECGQLAELFETPSFVVLDLAGYNPG